MGGVLARVIQSIVATTTMTTTSTSTGPSQSIGQGGDQPLEKNVFLTLTYRASPLPNINKTREKKDGKDKGQEQEKLVAKPSSPVQLINLNGDTNPMDGLEYEAS